MDFGILNVTVTNPFFSYRCDFDTKEQASFQLHLSLKLSSKELKLSFKMWFPLGDNWLKSIISFFKISCIPEDISDKEFCFLYRTDVPNPNKLYALRLVKLDAENKEKYFYLPMTPCCYGNMAELKRPFSSLEQLESFIAECTRDGRPHYIPISEEFSKALKERDQN